MRIAVSGCAGIGKTTLVNALAASLGIPVIAENYEPLFGPKGGLKGPLPKLAEAFLRIHETKRALESRHRDFVTDRCPVDIFHSWLIRGLATTGKRTDTLFEQCREQVRQYDLLVFPPWGVLELQQNHEVGVRRAPNPWVQLRGQTCMIGVALQWMDPRRLVHLPAAIDTVEQRVNYVRTALERSGT